ncbi:hypothetical protein [Brachybacterium sp. YJGR34]|uniref:hypothetical protein n=1 Tax=Brachybacterium sp. YJGR34 TaxID=2059911 RepID=UPI001300632C|nr:hypothetical protein [Brachybacterium sp. YJGR34]
MTLSTARRLAARAMPHGVSETTSAEVRGAFAASRASAEPARIEGIIDGAAATVPFYRRLGNRPLLELPVVDKTMMVRSPEDFLATGARPGRLPSRMSSGSSGIPFTSYLDPDRLARHRSQLVGGYRHLGIDPFGPVVHCRPWIHATRSQRLSSSLRGQILYAGEREEATLRRLVRRLSRARGALVVGLSSFVEILLRALEEEEIEIPDGSVGAVLGVGEPASRYLLHRAPRATGVPLSRRYSSMELGIMGLARGADEHYHLDTSTYHVEILETDSDAPAAPGAVGRIVVTDLHNRAMPFLRYDTGDLGRLARDASGSAVPNVLAELVGRRSDIPLGGTPEAPVRASCYRLFMQVDRLEGIRQFQLRQHAIGEFTWVLNAQPTAEIEASVRRLLAEEIGDIRRCQVEFVPEVPLSQSGKARFFLNEIPDPDALLRAPGR